MKGASPSSGCRRRRQGVRRGIRPGKGKRFLKAAPAVFGQVNPALTIKADAFRGQPHALFAGTAGGPRADLAAGIDHSMPGNALGACVHGPADGACAPRGAERSRDLTVRDHASARNPAHERVDAGKKGIPGWSQMPRGGDGNSSSWRLQFADWESHPGPSRFDRLAPSAKTRRRRSWRRCRCTISAVG